MKSTEKKALLRLLQTDDDFRIGKIINDLSTLEIASLLNEPSRIDIRRVFRLIPHQRTFKIFRYLDNDTRFELLKSLPLKQSTDILNRLSPDDRTSLFEYIPESQKKKWLNLLSEKEREISTSLLSYPENSVGRTMNIEFLVVREYWNVAQVMAYIRKFGKTIESIDYIYIVDKAGILLGDVKLKSVILSPINKNILDISEKTVISLNVLEDQAEAVKIFKDTRRLSLPVTNNLGELIGIVTIDDLLHIMEEKNTRDIHQIGGTEFFPEQYFKIPLLRMLKKRALWLVLLFVGEMLTATAMGFFENEIARAVVLALFVPLVISSGGNSGSQASTIIIRSLALREIHVKNWLMVFKREFSTGMLLGLILGIIGFLRIGVWSLFSSIYGPHWLLLGLTVGISLMGIVMWGTLTGAMLPILLRKIGLDPAVSSAPFVATLVDVTGLLIYFGVAFVILRGILL